MEHITFTAWKEFVSGLRCPGNGSAATTERFRSALEQILSALLCCPYVVGRQSATWCIRDCADVEAVDVTVHGWGSAPTDGIPKMCSFTGLANLPNALVSRVQVQPASSPRFVRSGYTVHQDVAPLLRAVFAVSSHVDYVTSRRDDEIESDPRLFEDLRNCCMLIVLATKALT